MAQRPPQQQRIPTLEDVFCFHNNKGGVGKTTLLFHMLVEFAKRHPNKTVVAVDMCRSRTFRSRC